MSYVAKTPREELECKKKYLYEYSMFWECNNGSKCQILEEDVCEKLNEQQATIQSLKEELELTANTKLYSRRKLEEENEQMKKQLEKIPKTIRKVWLED